jgi:hypothetical protein
MGRVPIDFREGMRRSGIALGILGCAAGCVLSFSLGFFGGAIQGFSADKAIGFLLLDCVTLLALPLLGFFIPWAIVRLLHWVVVGFTQGSVRWAPISHTAEPPAKKQQ